MCLLPENIPEREWHCDAAQHEVGDGEAHDEVVPRRPHYRLAQDGVLRGAGMGASQSNLGSLWGKVRRYFFFAPLKIEILQAVYLGCFLG